MKYLLINILISMRNATKKQFEKYFWVFAVLFLILYNTKNLEDMQ
jgi:hypothetical protein